MPIKFPSVHISKSVVTQILGVARELKSPQPLPQPAAPAPMPEPIVADPALQGAALDEGLGDEVTPVTGEDEMADELLTGMLQ